MTKYTAQEQSLIKSIVAMLSIKKVHDADIIKEVYQQIHKTIARKTLYNVPPTNQKGFVQVVQDYAGGRI